MLDWHQVFNLRSLSEGFQLEIIQYLHWPNKTYCYFFLNNNYVFMFLYIYKSNKLSSPWNLTYSLNELSLDLVQLGKRAKFHPTRHDIETPVCPKRWMIKRPIYPIYMSRHDGYEHVCCHITDSFMSTTQMYNILYALVNKIYKLCRINFSLSYLLSLIHTSS